LGFAPWFGLQARTPRRLEPYTIRHWLPVMVVTIRTI
jgi:hypothetical protein